MHWAGEKVGESCLEMVLSQNYIRLGMLEGALRTCDSLTFLLSKAKEELHHDCVKDKTVRWVSCKRTEQAPTLYFKQEQEAEQQPEQQQPAQPDQMRMPLQPPSRSARS